MGLQTGPGPDPGHPHMGHSQVGSQLAAAPMSAAVGRRPTSRAQDSGLQFLGLGAGRAASMSAVETLQTLSHKSSAPAADEHRAAVQTNLDFGVGKPLGEHQNHLGAVDIRGTPATSAGASFQPLAFGLAENDGLGRSEHASFTTLIK